MEWVIPIQTFETGRVRLGQMTNTYKKVLPLSYSDGEITFTHISLLLPALPVKSYDPPTGRLVLSLAGHSTITTKLQTLQDTLLVAVRNMQASWFPGEKLRVLEEIRAGFQTLIDGNNLCLYCPCTQSTVAANEISIYQDGALTRSKPAARLFLTGNLLRIAFKIQGLSFHQHSANNMWTGRFRFQHRILSILQQP